MSREEEMLQCWIGSLPGEITLEIVSQLDRPSLLSLSICSKRMNDLTAPTLYSIFEHSDHDLRALPLLIRTILKRPDLAQYVKKFIAFNGNAGSMDMMAVDDFDRIEEALYRLRPLPVDVEQWLHSVWSGRWSALTALLLSLLPKIEVFDLIYFGSSEDQEFRFINTILERARTLQEAGQLADPYSMARLRYVSLKDSSYDDWCLIRPENMYPYLHLLSIEKYSFEGFGENDKLGPEDWALQGDGDGGFRATTLVLQGKFLYTDSFPTFLRSFKSLKRFHCDYWGGFFPKTLADGIAQLSNCLEELSVTHSEPGYVFHSYDNTMNSILPLSGFTALKILEATAHSLLGGELKIVLPIKLEKAGCHVSYSRKYDMYYHQQTIQNFVKRMPPSLKHLTLLDCSEGIIDVLFELLKDNVLTNLRTLTISIYRGRNEDVMKKFIAVSCTEYEWRKKFSERSVDLCWVDLSPLVV